MYSQPRFFHCLLTKTFRWIHPLRSGIFVLYFRICYLFTRYFLTAYYFFYMLCNGLYLLMVSFKSLKSHNEYANRLKKNWNREVTFVVSFPLTASWPSQCAPGTNQCGHWVTRTPNSCPGHTTSSWSNVSSLEVKDVFFFFLFLRKYYSLLKGFAAAISKSSSPLTLI